MRNLHSLLVTLTVLALILVGATPVWAQDAIQINYQGHLTDDVGTPLTGDYSMVFVIYDEAGGSLWSETHVSVAVAEGRFQVMIGSAADLPSSLFDGEPRYLGIQVGTDPEIVPLTLLASVPGAASARRLVGNIETVQAASNLLRIFPPDPCVPPDPCMPALELIADVEVHSLNIHPPEPGYPPDPCEPALELTASAALNAIRIHPPDPCNPLGPLGPSFELETSATSASFAISDGGEVMGVEPSPFHPGYSLMLYDPASTNATEPKFEVYCGSEGTGFDIKNEIGKVMGVEPSPFSPGYSLKLFDPNAATETAIVEVSSTYGDGAYGRVNVGLSTLPDDIKPGVELTSGPSHGKILIGGTDPGTGAGPPMIVLQANLVAKVGIGTDTPSEALHVVGNVYVTGQVFAITDTKAKTNVVTIDNALNKVDMLEGVTYDLQADIAEKMGGLVGRQVGFLAQNVEEVLPEAVKTMNDGYKAVDYSRLTALLVEAVKDLKTENEQLRARVESLEAR